MKDGYNLKNIKQKFKEKGIYYTPKELGLYLKQFLPETVDKIYDPTCGDGALLELFDDKVLKFGQDVNGHQIDIAREKLKNFTGVVGDTLKEPAFKDMKFDYIIANPPFSIKWETNQEDERFSVAPTTAPPSKADYSFLLHILHYLSDTGVAVVLGFPGILYRSGREQKIRKWFVENNYIEKIIGIPGDKFVDTKVATVVIVLNKNKKDTNITFISDELKKEKIITLEQIKENDYNLSVNSYVYKEVIKEEIDIWAVEQQARKEFLKGLKNTLELSRLTCSLEGWDIKEYIRAIKQVIDDYEKNLRGEDVL